MVRSSQNSPCSIFSEIRIGSFHIALVHESRGCLRMCLLYAWCPCSPHITLTHRCRLPYTPVVLGKLQCNLHPIYTVFEVSIFLDKCEALLVFHYNPIPVHLSTNTGHIIIHSHAAEHQYWLHYFPGSE